jgi:outer membrane biosynthesis protein TonB
VTPSTGSDPATVEVEGLEFPYPEYLRNIVAQVYRRWERPGGNVSLKAEVFFLVHRDGSISNLRFVSRSGSFAFDLEAEGAVESAATAGAFGPLPEGFADDVLPVSFFFDPQKVR